jgi:hypothetical protein
MKCGFFENVLSQAWAIHADGDKWAGRGGPALPLPLTTDRISSGNFFQLAKISPFSWYLAIISPLSRHEPTHQTRMAQPIPAAAGSNPSSNHTDEHG